MQCKQELWSTKFYHTRECSDSYYSPNLPLLGVAATFGVPGSAVRPGVTIDFLQKTHHHVKTYPQWTSHCNMCRSQTQAQTWLGSNVLPDPFFKWVTYLLCLDNITTRRKTLWAISYMDPLHCASGFHSRVWNSVQAGCKIARRAQSWCCPRNCTAAIPSIRKHAVNVQTF